MCVSVYGLTSVIPLAVKYCIKQSKNADVQLPQEDLETGERESGSDTDVDGMSRKTRDEAKNMEEDEFKKLLSTSETVKGSSSRRRKVPLTKLVPAKVSNS